MTRIEIEKRLSEIREAVNAPEAPANEAELRAEYAKLERQWRESVDAEAPDADAAPPEPDAEGIEVRALLSKVELRRYMTAAISERAIDGAEAELNAALDVRSAAGVVVPYEALLPEDAEERADAPTNAPASLTRTQAAIIPRVFATGIARFLGIAMPTVPTGERQYTYLSAGATPEQKAKGAEVDADAATFTPVTFNPLRLTARYLFRIEDLAVFAGMEASLRGDLRMALTEAMDNQILNGDGQAPNVDGLLATAANGGLADVANNSQNAVDGSPNAVVTAASMVATYAAQVDGRYAKAADAIRVAIGAATYAKFAPLVQGDAFVFDRYAGRTRVEALLPAAAANIQQAVVAKTGAPGTYAVAPMWQGVELIRDVYSGAAKGEVAVTAIALWNFGVIRSAGFKRLKFKLA